jgi:hypothetical protein
MVILALTLLLGAVVQPAAAAEAPQGKKASSLQWRVDGGAEALEPTIHVRLVVANEIPPAEIDPRLGLVQTVVYLYSSGQEEAAPVERASREPGLSVARPDPELAALGGGEAEGTRVTCELPGLDDRATRLALALGRPVRVHGLAQDAARPLPEALRADRADLDERRRWAADTLILPGEERVVWEGTLPQDVDRLYADYLTVRARRAAAGPVPGAVVRAPEPDHGILELPPTASAGPAPDSPPALGAVLARPVGSRSHRLQLVRGQRNIIRIGAHQDATGSLAARVTTATEPLR